MSKKLRRVGVTTDADDCGPGWEIYEEVPRRRARGR